MTKKQMEMLDNATVWQQYREGIRRGGDEELAPRFETRFGDQIRAMFVRHPSGFLQAISWAMFDAELGIEPPLELGHCCRALEAIAEAFEYGKTAELIAHIDQFDPRK